MPLQRSSVRFLQPRRPQFWSCIHRTSAKRSYAVCSEVIRHFSRMQKSCCVAMLDEFVPLADFLLPGPVDLAASVSADATAPHESGDTSLPQTSDATEGAAAFAAARRFRAAVADAVDVAVQQLLAEIAENVLARELELRPADIGAIVAKTRE